jgi:hypothetical protein
MILDCSILLLSKVLSFLNSLNEKLTPIFEADLNSLLVLKKEEMGDAFDGKINSWDFR